MRKIGFLIVLAIMSFVGWYICAAGNEGALLIGGVAYYVPCAAVIVCSLCSHRYDWIFAIPCMGLFQVISQLFFLEQPQVMAWIYLIVSTLWCMRCVFGGSHDAVADVFYTDDWSLNDMSGDEWD